MRAGLEGAICQLQAKSVRELRETYETLFREPCYSKSKAYLVKRILWGLQSREENSRLSEAALARATELAGGAEVRLTAPRGGLGGMRRNLAIALPASPPPAGATLVRIYKGRRIVVRIEENGVGYDGILYPSLTAAAKRITGSHVSGRAFFGLKQRRRKAQ